MVGFGATTEDFLLSQFGGGESGWLVCFEDVISLSRPEGSHAGFFLRALFFHPPSFVRSDDRPTTTYNILRRIHDLDEFFL